MDLRKAILKNTKIHNGGYFVHFSSIYLRDFLEGGIFFENPGRTDFKMLRSEMEHNSLPAHKREVGEIILRNYLSNAYLSWCNITHKSGNPISRQVSSDFRNFSERLKKILVQIAYNLLQFLVNPAQIKDYESLQRFDHVVSCCETIAAYKESAAFGEILSTWCDYSGYLSLTDLFRDLCETDEIRNKLQKGATSNIVTIPLGRGAGTLFAASSTYSQVSISRQTTHTL